MLNANTECTSYGESFIRENIGHFALLLCILRGDKFNTADAAYDFLEGTKKPPQPFQMGVVEGEETYGTINFLDTKKAS